LEGCSILHLADHPRSLFPLTAAVHFCSVSLFHF
jgi:hypothetical protein